jgi:2-polyprenyl-6-methoxyphenol hydroxylase-like FAD-dependent oxidoreductase
MAETRKIQIAISGGGLAGVAIARALYQQAHVQVNVYKCAPEFSEKGMAIGMVLRYVFITTTEKRHGNLISLDVQSVNYYRYSRHGSR